MRGDQAFVIRSQLAGMTVGDADRALKTYWRQQADWITPDKVSWSYDERFHALSLDVFGDGNPGRKGDNSKGHSMTIPGAGFFAPDPLRRPKDQDQAAPWLISFPSFHCWATTIRLPKASDEFVWSLYAEKMDRKLGGIHYWRDPGMEGNVVRTVQSSHHYEPEATPEEAAIVNRAISSFNNNMSSIAEETPENAIKGVSPFLPFSDKVDWFSASMPCSAPAPYKAATVTRMPVRR